MSQLSQFFAQNQFCVLIEYLTSLKETYPVTTSFAGFPSVMTLADRVHTDNDLAPLDAVKGYPDEIDKLLHFAGKGRDIAEFKQFLHQAEAQSLRNLLLLTGDKLKQHQDGGGGIPRTRYLESVNAVMAAKQHGGFCIGVAFNPFKYTEAEIDAQYFKLHKKIKAGADFIISQLGYDMAALQQLQTFLQQHCYSQKLLACVMPLSLARAKFMLQQQVAGIVITPQMIKLLEQEKAAGLSERVYARCALQILICQHLGFAGVHLSACHKPEEQQLLQSYIEQYRNLDLASCQQMWHTLWQDQAGERFRPIVQQYAQQVSLGQIVKYQQLHLMHDTVFNSKLGRGIGHMIFNRGFWNKKPAAKALLKTELLSKHSVVGCDNCGQCRLADTLYICPETCPKGLANGPCGGTSLDRCEFGDRECIHSVKARLAKAVQQTDVLKAQLIEAVPVEVRGSSSWKNWYLQDEPHH
ncbi:methylenetetrahydrofolate reductase C-terminal domain-containing protein [Acinetobacter rudis]|uniref:methylenetetrahydrofolate reductase C-terminal domain-containing protein n=1 Tax=Acinetobacter rudis TaxID=632955 RepID=UPI00281096C0|nr:methylenetetrahydrofolate reductase C-terminal domain-containing protein [Acinetobacter rudis]MDQ8952349.1 methylenetetrahydrofolate reductase C-terminal domain-containing protein [Acinetobacter rudis]